MRSGMACPWNTLFAEGPAKRSCKTAISIRQDGQQACKQSEKQPPARVLQTNTHAASCRHSFRASMPGVSLPTSGVTHRRSQAPGGYTHCTETAAPEWGRHVALCTPSLSAAPSTRCTHTPARAHEHGSSEGRSSDVTSLPLLPLRRQNDISSTEVIFCKFLRMRDHIRR